VRRVLWPALRAELTKAYTVRSTWWSLLVAVVLSVGLAALISLSLRDNPVRGTGEWDPVAMGYLGLTMGLVVLVVFGVMVVSAEFTSGTIRASLAAVPRRGVFFTAKALAVTVIATVVAVPTAFAAFFAAQAVLGERGVSLGEPEVLRAVLGAAAYLALMCVFATGVAMMLRSTALCLGILIPILFLNSQGLSNMPAIRVVTQYLPDQAGMVLMQTVRRGRGVFAWTDYGPAGAFAILLAWALLALGGGYLVLRRHDA
jgi:ABC-2 type transport system permease protein